MTLTSLWQPWGQSLQSTSVLYLKQKAQITTDVSMLIMYGPELLENDSGKPLATLAAFKEVSSPSRVYLCLV